MTSNNAQPPDEQLKAAWAQLSLVQGFFGRIDTKLAVILGLALAMLATLATRLPALKDITPWLWLFVVLTVSPLLGCLVQLFCTALPRTRGGTNSLVYFKEIAGLKESEFLAAVQARSQEDLTRDLYGQVWRNAEILKKKFAALERAYLLLLGAAVPWLVAVTWVSLPTWP